MRKTTFVFALLLIAVLKVSAEVITVWEGTKAGNLTFFSGEDTYNTLMGNGTNQANLSAGDKIDIYYTGAVEGSKLWLQDNEWNTYPASVTGADVDLLSAGDGVFTINVSQEFVDALKVKGLRLRRGGEAVYSFTKVNVVKGDGVSGGGSSGTGDDVSSGIVVWEGSAASTLRFTPESGSYLDNYNKLIGDAEGQANLSAGDKIKFYYTGAAAEDQVWFQDMEWNNITAIDQNSPTIEAGDGSYEFMVNVAAVEAIKQKGIMLRRPNNSSYTFTKVEVIKAQIGDDVIVPDASETIVWSGSATGSVSVDFRNDPNRSALLGADLQPGKFIKVYMSDVDEGDQIYIKETASWECLNTQTTMTAGTQVFIMELTEEIINKIKTSGMIIQRQGNGTTYDFEIRYVTVANAATSGISHIGNGPTSLDGDVVYNLRGQRVSTDYKGIVIKNGRKYINR